LCLCPACHHGNEQYPAKQHVGTGIRKIDFSVSHGLDLVPYSRPTSIFETRPGATGTPANFSACLMATTPSCFVLEPEKSDKNEHAAIYGINGEF
jgi:hypothetical protein